MFELERERIQGSVQILMFEFMEIEKEAPLRIIFLDLKNIFPNPRDGNVTRIRSKKNLVTKQFCLEEIFQFSLETKALLRSIILLKELLLLLIPRLNFQREASILEHISVGK